MYKLGLICLFLLILSPVLPKELLAYVYNDARPFLQGTKRRNSQPLFKPRHKQIPHTKK